MSGGSNMSAGGGNNSKKKSPANNFPLSTQVPVSIPSLHIYFFVFNLTFYLTRHVRTACREFSVVSVPDAKRGCGEDAEASWDHQRKQVSCRLQSKTV